MTGVVRNDNDAKEKIFVIFIFQLLFVNNSFSIPVAIPTSCKGIWSALSSSPYEQHNFSSRKVFSPDKKMMIEGTGNGIRFHSNVFKSTLDIPATPALSEIVWSPNSDWFSVNYSDGGLVGTWNSRLYFVKNGFLKRYVDINKTISIEHDKLNPQCDEPEDLNFGIIMSMHSGNTLVIAAEVPPHSSCKNMGETKFFTFDLDKMKISKGINRSVLNQTIKNNLGCRFF